MTKIIDYMPRDVLLETVRNVGLLNNPDVKPYIDADIDIRIFDIRFIKPTTLYLLRTNLSVQRSLSSELAEQGHDPLQLDGRLLLETPEQQIGLIPPIVEHDPEFGDCLIDGAHRTYVGRASGRTAIRAIYIRNANPEHPIYADPNEWSDVIEYDEVPKDAKLKKRYRTETPQDLYRDLRGLNGGSMRIVE